MYSSLMHLPDNHCLTIQPDVGWQHHVYIAITIILLILFSGIMEMIQGQADLDYCNSTREIQDDGGNA